MLIALALSLLLQTASEAEPEMIPVIIAPPELPTGRLAVLGSTGAAAVLLDPASVQRSDIPGYVRATAVALTAGPPPMMVVQTLWIQCESRTYQRSPGRMYDLEGREIAAAPSSGDQPIAPDSAPAKAAEAFCGAQGPDLSGLETVADYHHALVRTGLVEPRSPDRAPDKDQ
jgi:hypothetical protein